MAFLKFWRKEPKASAPEWASFLTPLQYEAFEAAVRAEVAKLGSFEMADGVIHLQPHDGSEPQRLGLRNVARKCVNAPMERFPQIIEEHFATVFGPNSDRALAAALEASAESAAPYLKPRLFEEASVAALVHHLVYRPVAPGILAVLVMDLPNTVATVSAETVARWGADVEALWARALENLRWEEPAPTRTDELLGESARAFALMGESFFVTSHLLILREHLPVVPPAGALVIAPHRHLLVVHPIVGIEVIQAITRLLNSAIQLYKTGPGPISPGLYWWRDGELRLLPSRVEQQALIFEPPAEFVQEVLEPLVARDAGD